ncbi:MAG: squalene/phytoene synthase family protein [Chitinispirillales bacterium]|jgi:farnesyl-diphosphate farnesyltransferase|nr:squalene/phytoene synthase family protein [Chitinispirillales bacterium]
MDDERLEKLKQSTIRGEKVDAKLYNRLILGKVSRTYALTIRSLGEPFREPVLIGYLFCRIADTYEDSEILSVEQKSEALNNFIELFLSEGKELKYLEKIREICKGFRIDDNEEFLALYPQPAFERYATFPSEVKKTMISTVCEMVEGMKKTVIRQNTQKEIGTKSLEELEEYCYFVAGTVGNMLTDLFFYYSPWINEKLYEQMCEHRHAFGEALQLTNIIKDAMGDLKRGVSFIPRDLALQYGVDLEKLYLPQNRRQAQDVMNALIVKAVKSLNRAVLYSILIPKQEPRMRIFCIMPVLFAIKTLAVAVENSDKLLDADGKVKITRDEVKKTIKFITLNCVWDYQLVVAYEKDLKRIEKALDIQIEIPFKKAGFLPIVHLAK